MDKKKKLEELIKLDRLKRAYAAGAWIFGIERDGKMHRLTSPVWGCHVDSYIAVWPMVV